MSGVAAVNVSDTAYNEPKDPPNNAINAFIAVSVFEPDKISNSKPRNIARKVAIIGIKTIS